MTTTLENIKYLKSLRHNQCGHINYFEGGGAEVHRIFDVFVLFCIQEYGGEPSYIGTYVEEELPDLVTTVESWV